MAQKVDDKGLIRILVYGTLKDGHGNHRLIKNSGGRFIRYDSITGPFQMCNMTGFPGVYRNQEGDLGNLQTIKGELWALEPEGLATLDLLEGHPNFYRREKYWTNGNNGDAKKAWVYILNPNWLKGMKSYLTPDRIIPEGIWKPSAEETKFWEAA